MNRIHSPSAIAAHLRMEAARFAFDGRETIAGSAYLRACRFVDGATGTILIYTRDIGHHTSGWFKNPDYERCRHLSLSFIEPVIHGALSLYPRTRDLKMSRMWLDHFFTAGEQPLLWGEPPVTPDAKVREVWHYRLFCDEHWNAIHPRGEVYSMEFTERGWKSASELFGTEGRIVESPLHPG